MENKPKVSILIISYNHEQYIAQTLDSVLMQKTDFPFEIVIGDDASPDKTRNICEDYAQKYPHIIRVLPTPQNLGVVPNYIRTLAACRGQYIAHLDGDDYWIDDEKLQKQVNRLDADPNLTICYTSRRIIRFIRNPVRDGIKTTPIIPINAAAGVTNRQIRVSI